MKSVIILSLISISFCGFITQEEVDELRSFAPSRSTKPTRTLSRTTPRSRSATSSKSNSTTQRESRSRRSQSKPRSPMTSVPSTPSAKEQSGTKHLVVHAGPSPVRCFPAENLHQERRRNCPIPARLSLMR